jgi:uncharacterized membrane protein
MAQHKRHPLTQHVDEQQISDAIKAAEQNTTGKVYVTLSPHFWGDTRRGAHRVFHTLRGAHPMDKNGVLFFVVPSRRELHVLGGAGIHQKVGQSFWDRLVADVATQIKGADLTAGIVHGINETGQALAHHYPRPKDVDKHEG